MTDTILTVAEGTRVHLNFSLSLEDGSEVDSNFGGEAVSFAMGDGSLLPGFEACLVGMRPGERKLFSLAPEQAFGETQQDNIQSLPRKSFDADAELATGVVFNFADAAGGEVPGVVTAFDDETVTVDFNHPLAGRTILFDAQVHRVEPAEVH